MNLGFWRAESPAAAVNTFCAILGHFGAFLRRCENTAGADGTGGGGVISVAGRRTVVEGHGGGGRGWVCLLVWVGGLGGRHGRACLRPPCAARFVKNFCLAEKVE